MPTPLHAERLEAVVSALLASGAQRVLDLGCGRGELLEALRPHAQFTRLVGIDIDVQALELARARLGLDWLREDARIAVRFGSFEEGDAELAGFDAAVLLETIEHIDPGRLPRVECAVFAGMRPRTVLVTTPNREYNALMGMAAGRRRHPDHRFEWDRAQFEGWATAVAARHGYAVACADLGGVRPGVGGASQLARFDLER